MAKKVILTEAAQRAKALLAEKTFVVVVEEPISLYDDYSDEEISGEEPDEPLSRQPIRFPDGCSRRECARRKPNGGHDPLYKGVRRGLGRATANYMLF